MSASARAVVPNYGIDADRVLALDRPVAWARRRFEGRFAVDEFGGDPHMMDLFAPIPAATIRVDVEHPERVPRTGAALLVSNRGLGIVEPLVLGLAVRRANGRRLRIVGAPDVPLLGPFTRKLGAIAYRPSDVAAVLRSGHLAGAPMGMTWLQSGAGEPPRPLVAATLGFPVVPVAIRPGGPFGLPIGLWPAPPWRVVVGEPLLPPAGTPPDDQLAAAELSEAAREAVAALLQEGA